MLLRFKKVITWQGSNSKLIFMFLFWNLGKFCFSEFFLKWFPISIPPPPTQFFLIPHLLHPLALLVPINSAPVHRHLLPRWLTLSQLSCLRPLCLVKLGSIRFNCWEWLTVWIKCQDLSVDPRDIVAHNPSTPTAKGKPERGKSPPVS